MRRKKPPADEAKLIEDAESVALFESAIRSIKERYAENREGFRLFLQVLAEARRLPKNRCAGDHRPLVKIQACRPEDRAILETPAGAELVTAAAAALDNEAPRPISSDYPPTVEDLRAAGLWPFPERKP